MVPENRETVLAEGFVQRVYPEFYLVPPLALLNSEMFSSLSALALNSCHTLRQRVCQRDGAARQAVFHRLPHHHGDNNRQVSLGSLPSDLEGRRALPPARMCCKRICCVRSSVHGVLSSPSPAEEGTKFWDLAWKHQGCS